MNMYIYRATGFLEIRDVHQQLTLQNTLFERAQLINRHVSKNTSSVIIFTHSPSFFQQNIVKSNGHFSKMDRDVYEDL